MKHEAYDQFLPALKRRISDVVAEYDLKRDAINQRLEEFAHAGRDLISAASIGGGYASFSLNVGSVYDSQMKDHLLKSAWRYMYDSLNIPDIASANDKRKFEMAMSNPPPFTLENISATFESYILDPRGSILRGLAEVFCSLDPYYRSHEKVKIGVKGLPKRIIIRGVRDYGSYGLDKIRDVLNALAAYQGKPLVEWRELSALRDREDALLNDGELPSNRTWDKPTKIVGRGVRLRRFDNGNGHLIFERDALLDINRALAEFYGSVLPDTPDERPERQAPGTDIARDLSFYRTPKDIVERVLAEIYITNGQRILEPSCGDGAFLDGIRNQVRGKGTSIRLHGVEVHAGRAAEARRKGFAAMTANFLEVPPEPVFDHVIMNPPFYGRHYAKHVEHAMKFLKPGGRLTAILPATARYDHGLLEGSWDDLPVGSFSESGTNINTTVLTKIAPEKDR